MSHLTVASSRAATALLIAGAITDAAATGYGYGGPSLTADEWPTAIVERPLTLARGMFEIAAPFGADLSVGDRARAANVPLALHAGITDALTVGIGHTRGFCLADAAGGCSATYDHFRVEALARFYAAGPFSAAYGAAVAATSLHDEVAVSAEAQLALRLAYDRFALVLAPEYGFGLNRRGSISRISPATFPLASSLAFGTSSTVPNRETVHAPLTADVQVLPRIALAAAIAVDGVVDPLAGSFADTYHVPVGFAAAITPTRILDVGVAFVFPNLLGRSDGARPRSDERAVQAFLSLRTGGGGPRPAVAAAVVPVAPQVAVDAAPPPPTARFTVLISQFTFSPATLDVPPGATVTVHNGDDVPHSVTSESAPGEFAPGAVAGVSFDTGTFTGERSFTIPADAVPGTAVPYYCAVHKGRMATPNGEIRIVAAH